ncbi:MAG TPA: hypothetical protein GX530_06820, partial [Corynebacteriales bacterium]|nr:hypothetical protein [Mycobacteriales bacterium]
MRNTSYAAARSKIGEIMTALHGLYEQTLGGGDGDEGNGDEGGDGDEGNGGGGEPIPANGTRYLLIKARGSPEILKRD